MRTVETSMKVRDYKQNRKRNKLEKGVDDIYSRIILKMFGWHVLLLTY